MQYRDQDQRPSVAKPQFESIPQELKEIPNWVLWKFEWKESAWSKVPLQLLSGQKASVSNPGEWAEFAAVESFFDRYPMADGVGFVFTKEIGIIGIDIDNCIKWDSGKPIFDEWAKRTLARLPDTHVEFSPSRTGLHILVRGQIPHSIKYSPGGIEIYDSSRYFTITGDAWNDAPIAEAGEEVSAIVSSLVALRESQKPEAQSINHPAISNPQDIAERLRVAFASANGSKIKALFDGDTTGYDSPSEADFALCRYLCFYSDGNAGLLSDLMNGSVLLRKKWYRRQTADGQTYLDEMIGKILATETKFWQPAMRFSVGKVSAPADYKAERKNRHSMESLRDSAIEFRKRTDLSGMPCVWENLNRIYRPRYRTLTVWTGEPGAGKSTLILAYLYHFANHYAIRAGLCSFEISPPEMLLLELVQIHTQRSPFAIRNQYVSFDDPLSDDELCQAINELDPYFSIFDPEWEESNVQGLQPIIEAEKKDKRMDLFYLDPFTELQPPDKLLGKYTDFASVQLSLLRSIVKEQNLIAHLVCHPTKGFNRSEGLRLWNINGSGDFERKTDFGFVVTRENNVTVAHLQKLRFRFCGIEDSKAAFKLDPKAYYFTETNVPLSVKGAAEKSLQPF